MLEKTHLDELLLFGKQGGLEGLEALGGGGVGVDHQAQVLRMVRMVRVNVFLSDDKIVKNTSRVKTLPNLASTFLLSSSLLVLFLARSPWVATNTTKAGLCDLETDY